MMAFKLLEEVIVLASFLASIICAGLIRVNYLSNRLLIYQCDAATYFTDDNIQKVGQRRTR